MGRIVLRKNVKISNIIIFIIILVSFLTILIYKIYGNIASNKIKMIADTKINEYMEYYLSSNIGSEILGDYELEDILELYKNSDGEIIYASFNLTKAYETLDVVTKHLSNLIEMLENGNGNIDNNIVRCKNGIALTLPLFIFSDNILITNLGPKIYIPINFIGSILTNIKSNIVSYGFNNALVELYITISITTNIITPVESTNKVISYDVLIASFLVSGRVPEAYGGTLSYQTQQYSLPID